jgi:hypothetical protein
MIRLNLQMFAKGSSGADIIGASQTTSKYEHPGNKNASASMPQQTSGGGTSKASAQKQDDQHVTSLSKGETYELFRVREDGTEKYYDRDDYENIKEELEGYKPDSKTGLWRDKYGKRYRVVRVKQK